MYKALYDLLWTPQDSGTQAVDSVSTKIPIFVDGEADTNAEVIQMLNRAVGRAKENIKFDRYLSQGAFGAAYTASVDGKDKWVVKIVVLQDTAAYDGFMKETEMHRKLASRGAAPRLYKAWVIPSDDDVIDYDHHAYGIVIMERLDRTVWAWAEEAWKKVEETVKIVGKKIVYDSAAVTEYERRHLVGIRAMDGPDNAGFTHFDYKSDNVMVKQEGGELRAFPIDYGAMQNYNVVTGERLMTARDQQRVMHDVRIQVRGYDAVMYAFIEYYGLLAQTYGALELPGIRAILMGEGKAVRERYAYVHGWWGAMSAWVAAARPDLEKRFLPVESSMENTDYHRLIRSLPVKKYNWDEFVTYPDPDIVELFIQRWEELNDISKWPISSSGQQLFIRAGLFGFREVLAGFVLHDCMFEQCLRWLVKNYNLVSVIANIMKEIGVKPFTPIPEPKNKTAVAIDLMDMPTPRMIGDQKSRDIAKRMKYDVRFLVVLGLVVLSRKGFSVSIPSSWRIIPLTEE